MRVLLISHTCQSTTEGQPKAQQLGTMPGVELCVLSPKWLHLYGTWREAQRPDEPAFRFDVQNAMWAWAGPAQWYLHWYPGMKKLVRDFEPDVIDLWEEPWSLVSAQACWLRNHLAPKAKIVSETEQNIDKKLPFPFERLRAYTLRNADFVVGRSSEAIEVIRRKGYSGPAQVVPNAVDADLFRPMDQDACRAELGLDGFSVGYVGRLVEEKGIADLIAAIEQCPNDVKLLSVGDGPMSNALAAAATQGKLAGRVRLLAAQPLEKLPAIFNAMDVLALPSRTTRRWKEQFGRVIIEAHACGVPVIGSSSGAIPDVVGQGGLIVLERNVRAFTDAILALRCDKSLRNRMGKEGRRTVEARYTWRWVAENMRDIYQQVCNSPSSVVAEVVAAS